MACQDLSHRTLGSPSRDETEASAQLGSGCSGLYECSGLLCSMWNVLLIEEARMMYRLWQRHHSLAL